jgi:TetR/AcrR family transcriptional repressor of nem operon
MSKPSAKEKVIEASIALMTDRGFNATTVDDIVKQAGVAKGSVYHAFKSKEELAIASLEHYLQQGLAIVGNGPYTGIEDPVRKALAFVQYIEERSPDLWSHGCLLGSMAIEVGDTYPAVISEIDRMFKKLERAMAAIFAPALAARGVVGVTAKDLSIHLLAVIEGSIIAAKSHGEPQFLKHGIQHFRQYLELLLK